MIKSNEYIKFNSKKVDILKLLLAVLVVCIHTTKVGVLLRPVFRIAVPLFFIITSYLFFLKQSQLATLYERRRALWRYVKRILILYLFWFVVLLEPTSRARQWFDDFGIDKMLDIVKNFFLSSTFMASWFLMASVVAVVIVWFLAEKKVKDLWLLVLGAVSYVCCCMVSNYYFLCQSIPGFEKAYTSFAQVFTSPYNSFPVALLFVAMGKCLAQRSLHLSTRALCTVLGLSLVLIYCEFFFIKYCGTVVNDDCYLALPLLCMSVFMLVGQSAPLESSFDTKALRACSTIIYCSHATIAYQVGCELRELLLNPNSFQYLAFRFVGTFLCVFVLSYTILQLEKLKPLSFLRYSH